MIFRSYISVVAVIFMVFLLCGVAKAESPKQDDLYKWNFSNNDMAFARKADSLAKRGLWNDSLATAKKAKSKVIWKLFFWRMLMSGNSSENFLKITKFIEDNPSWPEQEIMESTAEKAIDENTEGSKIIEWFTKKRLHNGNIIFRSPITANGKIKLAEALMNSEEMVGVNKKRPLSEINRLDIEKFIREGWIEENFTSKKEWEFLAKHRDILTKQDYIKRADKLLWDENIEEAQRAINLLDGDWRNLFEARFKLKTYKFGLDAALNAVPEYLKNDEGLLYDRIKWRERIGRDDDVIDLLLTAPGRPENPASWWRLKEKHIYDLMSEKKYAYAYKFAKDHGFTEDIANFAEAEWLAGWIALRFINNPRNAYRHFYRIYHHKVKSPISLGRASYWAGRGAEANGNLRIAQKWYSIAARFPTSFYGQLSAEKIGLPILYIPSPPSPTWSDINHYKNSEIVKAVYILQKLGRPWEARKLIRHAVTLAKTPGEKRLITEMGIAIGKPDLSISAAKEASRDGGQLFVNAHFPKLKSTKSVTGKEIQEPEKALIHAIIMQESLFDKDARSGAGAMGMMQLLPATAKETADKMKIPFNREKLTSDYRYNITLGSYYLNSLIERFDGSYILGIAAYNGGATNVRRWINANGDPRKFGKPEEVIDWLEMIPFKETNNYVQRVIENLQVYRFMLNQDKKPVSRTASDIMRKTVAN